MGRVSEQVTTGRGQHRGFHRGWRTALVGLLVFGGALASSVAASQAASADTSVTLYVANGGNDSGNDCTVQATPCATIQTAIAVAIGGSYGGDDVTIEVAAGSYSVHGETFDATSPNSLTFAGAGATTTTINAAGGGGFDIGDGGTVTFDGLTITGANPALNDFGAIGAFGSTNLIVTNDVFSDDADFNDLGGAITASGDSLIATDDTFSDDNAREGGAIYGGAPMTIANDTFVGDTVTPEGSTTLTGVGGAIYSGGGTITNSTFVDDGAAYGGALDLHQGTFTLIDDTFSDDTGATEGGAIYSNGNNGTIFSVADSIFDSANCDYLPGGTVTDGGYNVSSDNTCASGTTDVINSSSIGLSPLAANGSSGPQTMAIGPDSSAYEVVPATSCTVATDERGDSRPGAVGHSCDAGAFELQVFPAITSFSPASGPVGAKVKITGTNLAGATKVAFNGKAATITKDSATKIIVKVPSGATTGKIKVTTPEGSVKSATKFTVIK
jgi:IPT/TIG domain